MAGISKKLFVHVATELVRLQAARAMRIVIRDAPDRQTMFWEDQKEKLRFLFGCHSTESGGRS